MNETIRKFGYPDTLIHEYERWVVLLRPQQVTLGSLVLACKEPVHQFHEVSAAGFAELKSAVSDIETGLAALVGYQKMNYLMLMMVDPDVHFHVIPRYEAAARFEDVAFADHGWPGPPALAQFTETSGAVTSAITARLKQHWPTA
jgi:diadenosine tetraphosphate (Ap4A) HIT family hydrolase